MQLRARHIARNVLSNWFVTLCNMGVGFFLAPFLVHRLGNDLYGVWVLAISSVGYFVLLDLGMRSSVLRYVSRAHAAGDHAAASDAFSAAFRVRLQIGAGMLLLSVLLAALFPRIFRVPPQTAHTAQIAVLIVGVNMTVSMVAGVFGGVLSALNRYDLQGAVTLLQLVLRVGGVVLVLRQGHGLIAIAGCEFLAASAANVLLIGLARRIYPELRVHLEKPRPGLLRELWSYSVYALLTTVALQLIYQTDNLVVGSFVSVTAVTTYAIGNSLCRYADQFLSGMAMTFVPAASNFEATGNAPALRRLYRHGTQAMLAVALPVVITLMLRGGNFIALWMGPGYVARSSRVLTLLAFPLLFSYGNRIAMSVAFGIGKHRVPALWAVGEGVANLLLSVILVHFYGIFGVAIGTLVPSLFAQLVLWPRYLPELVGMGRGEALRTVWGPVFLAAVPFAAASWALRYVPAPNLFVFALQTTAALALFAAALGWGFRRELRTELKPRLRSFPFLRQSPPQPGR